MKFNVDSTKLFEGLAEVVAKQVEGNALPLLKPIDEAQDQLEVSGSAVAKTDVDARHVLEELMDAKVRMERDAVYQQNEWLKHDLASERKRTLVYKEKYEASEEIIVELEERNERQKEEIRIKDEEIKKLRAQLEYAEKHPQSVTNVYGNQHNHLEDNRSQVAVKEIAVKDSVVGAKTCEKKEVENSVTDDIGYCEYIEEDKVDQITRYGKTKEERLDKYNRVIYRSSQRDARTFAKFLKGEEGKGLVFFDGMAPSKIYAHFKEIYGSLPYEEPAFRSACHYVKWQPANKRKV